METQSNRFFPVITRKMILWAVFGLVAFIFLLRSCTMVPAGSVKVVDFMGSVSKRPLEPGPRLTNPIANRITMDTRVIEMKEHMETPTSEGLTATVDVSLLFSLLPGGAPGMYKEYGINWVEKIVLPNLRSATRDVIANYKSEDLYSKSRTTIASDISARLEKQFLSRNIMLDNKDGRESVLLRDLQLPAEVKSAIERKIKEKQASEQMEFTLLKETQESERKRIEARGIADAQKIIAESLTSPYLQWRFTSVMEKAAESPNSTFWVPYGTNLLPMVNLDKK
jgi:regulator of protease activity HflC (stomatin/prohibitin superfamily)